MKRKRGEVLAAIKIDPSRLPAPRLAPTYSMRVEPTPGWLQLEREERARKRREIILGKIDKSRQRKGPGRPFSIWTADLEARVSEMYIAGKNNGEIAKALGMSKDQIVRHVCVMRKAGTLPKIKRLGERGWTDEQIRTLVEQYADGIPIREIAKTVGRSEGGCSAKLTELKKERRRHR